MHKKMQPHHEAWLAAHPRRTAEWLIERLADGFHVHHMDGDHDNNDPKNLVLIEGEDHMMIHTGDYGGGLVAYMRNKQRERRDAGVRKLSRKAAERERRKAFFAGLN